MIEQDSTRTRRTNAKALFQEFAQQRIAAGAPGKGLEQEFAALLEISPSMWSQLKASRPISDKMARQIEHHTRRPAGWLDEPHEGLQVVDEAEEHFLEEARKAWRAQNSRGKRTLLRYVRTAQSAPVGQTAP